MALMTAALGVAPCLQAASGTWTAPGGGDYFTTSNWLDDAVPNGENDIATFGNEGDGAVEVNGGVTVKGIVFEADANAYTIAPSSGFHIELAIAGGSITATGTGANAQLITTEVYRKGSATISNDYVSTEHTLTVTGNLKGWTNAPSLLTLSGGNMGANTIGGIISDDVDGGKTTLNKTGTGTWILSGRNTYGGATNIEGGMLFVSGTHAPQTAAAYTIDGGALGGAGGTIAASGVTLSGNTGSAINVSGAGLGSVGSQAALTTPGVLELDLGSTALDISQAGGGALQFVLTTPENSDRVRLSSGTLAIGDGVLSLSNFSFDLSNWAEEGAEGTYILFSTASPDAIVGSLADHDLSAVFGSYHLTLSLGSDASSFDTLELNVAAVPEPSVLGAILFGAALLLGSRWRRREVC